MCHLDSEQSLIIVAGVKYIKKTKDVEADAPPKKTSARAAANTKAKVTAKNDTDADEKPATTTTRGRGRPKAADTKAAKSEEEAPKRKPGRP
ncbi:hypothetical protein KCU71_g11938, partial [Aureobasidium melanogenum]